MNITIRETYFDDGNINVIYHYDQDSGNKEGEYKRWHSDKILAKHLFYKRGKLHGTCKYFDYAGALYKTEFRIKGEYHGKQIYLKSHGGILSIHFYNKGVLFGQQKSCETNILDRLVNLARRH